MVPANTDPSGKWPIKWRGRETEIERCLANSSGDCYCILRLGVFLYVLWYEQKVC